MNRPQWSKDSWRPLPALQQVDWPDKVKYQEVLKEIESLPPLVFAGEIRNLKSQLALAAEGKAFLLQGGDCAEEFASCSAPTIRETLKVILQMAVVMSFAGEKPVIKVGRIAGQYAKPRSSPTETVNGVELPSYRGDIVNRPDFTAESRMNNADNLLGAYWRSASTLNILRAFTNGGYAALDKVHKWNKDFVRSSTEGKKYEALANDIDKALRFMDVIGFNNETRQIKEVDFYTSHEALLLGYEEALTRQDSLTGDWYDCSAHMLWIGDRTRQLDHGHIEFLRGVGNPIGMKVGPNHNIDELKRIIETVNPENEAGKLTLITRFGSDNVEKHLPGILREIKKEGMKVVWSCDPMHGNTYLSDSKYKTRNFENILGEIRHFFAIHKSEGTHPGGVHFELTGQDVTECVGGAQKIGDDQLQDRYKTSCDPRLNAQQSLELSFLISEFLHQDIKKG